jgi:hypothetical protein
VVLYQKQNSNWQLNCFDEYLASPLLPCWNLRSRLLSYRNRPACARRHCKAANSCQGRQNTYKWTFPVLLPMLFCCFEKFLKFVSKNAYIQTAILGTPFYKSSCQSFRLIFRNSRRTAAVSYVSPAVLIVGKLFISSMTTIEAYMLLTQKGIYGQLHSFGGPLAVIFLTSYWMSDFL